MRLSKKSARRFIIAGAMVAPIVYLFGTMGAYLLGAHNGLEINDEPSLYQGITYDEAMTREKFSYDYFDWVNHNEDKTRIGFSLGYLQPEISVYTDLEFNATPYGISSYNNGYIIDNHGLGFSGNIDSAYIDYHLVIDSDTQLVDDNWIDDSYLADDSYFCFYVSEDYSSWPWHILACVVYSDDVLVWHYNRTTQLWNTLSWSDVDFFDWYQPKFFFDDGQNLPSQVVWDDELRSYFVPTLKQQETTSKSNYLFGQFFPRGNFLEKIGQNALSESPIGFVPFGAFLRFLDVNMLHAGGNQIALMMYGQVYWMLHVVLADLIYHCLVFIPNLIMHVSSKFGGGLNDD